MKIDKIDNFKKGWFVGEFYPTLLSTNFEVAYQRHKQNEEHIDHFHKKATEINLLVRGNIIVNGQKLSDGDIFVINPYEVSHVEYLTDAEIIVVRNCSDTADKYNFKIF